MLNRSPPENTILLENGLSVVSPDYVNYSENSHALRGCRTKNDRRLGFRATPL